jgi:hypothetical protein
MNKALPCMSSCVNVGSLLYGCVLGGNVVVVYVPFNRCNVRRRALH